LSPSATHFAPRMSPTIKSMPSTCFSSSVKRSAAWLLRGYDYGLTSMTECRLSEFCFTWRAARVWECHSGYCTNTTL
jgi:hypothetical protein